LRRRSLQCDADADGQHHRQPHDDYFGQLRHPDCFNDQRDLADGQRYRRKFVYLAGHWRDANRQPEEHDHLYRDRDRPFRPDHGDDDPYGVWFHDAAAGADRHHDRQPHFDYHRRFLYLDGDSDQCHLRYGERL
jgi:hypothetical protein